jgi:hypothetical protein
VRVEPMPHGITQIGTRVHRCSVMQRMTAVGHFATFGGRNSWCESSHSERRDRLLGLPLEIG